MIAEHVFVVVVVVIVAYRVGTTNVPLDEHLEDTGGVSSVVSCRPGIMDQGGPYLHP
jgi:hypothetical protein